VPCQICEKPDWCTISADGAAACCMRVESERRLGNGGWLHKQGRDMLGAPMRAQGAPPKPQRYLGADVVGDRWARWAGTTTDGQVAELATALGVSAESLRAVGACWAWPHEAWGFPMFDGDEEFAGMRLRSIEGDKWALRGSRQGLFLPDMKACDEALVVEGPTDTAAGVSLGFHTIGRPSCTGGVREIRAFCRKRGIRRLSILADNDGPGIRGARTLAKQVRMQTRIVVLPAKDLREWLRYGATKQALEACLAAHKWSV